MKTFSNHPQIEKLVNGDKVTLTELYKNLFPKVISYIYNNKGTRKDAEEVFHDALYQLVCRAKIKGVQINSSFHGYVFTVCKNLWLKQLNNRKKEVRNEGIFELKANEDETVKAILHQERWELFEEKMLLLSENCKALLKDFFNKVSYKVIVKKFNYASENTAFQRVFKCKKKLADLVKADSRYKDLS